jgi:hypothetical protein
MKRSSEILKKKLQQKSLAMYKQSTPILMGALTQSVDEFRVHLEAAPNELLAKARAVLGVMLDGHNPTDPATMKAISSVKVKLQSDVNTVIDNLAASLENNVHIPLEEEEDVPTYDVEEPILIDDEDESQELDLDAAEAATAMDTSV